MHFRNFEEYWPFYVNQHTKISTRRWHFCATGLAAVFTIAGIVIKWWLLFFAPLFGFGLAWYSHFFIEGNKPGSFGHPIWSFICDYKMFILMLTGRMDREIKRLGKRPMLQEDEYMVGRRYFDAKQENRIVLRRQTPRGR
ncbi:uncharacterized protein [Physcomitrium patens]|uniref:DUF962 domain-containing protein n=1 Tax=Physcomitrium patens TaxID=3218 RepID=A0A2K1K359_PHYPA|nr:uncharacterized protein LOC112286258 [Physcomitrium patens]PNR48206.1 hypothetical protein PHYPA_012681 [Physcomitrium patens]|eukprot:XP_024383751.1 uncharacterized protein LOC112286258 [Physcomitrella patens]